MFFAKRSGNRQTRVVSALRFPITRKRAPRRPKPPATKTCDPSHAAPHLLKKRLRRSPLPRRSPPSTPRNGRPGRPPPPFRAVLRRSAPAHAPVTRQKSEKSPSAAEKKTETPQKVCRAPQKSTATGKPAKRTSRLATPPFCPRGSAPSHRAAPNRRRARSPRAAQPPPEKRAELNRQKRRRKAQKRAAATARAAPEAPQGGIKSLRLSATQPPPPCTRTFSKPNGRINPSAQDAVELEAYLISRTV